MKKLLLLNIIMILVIGVSGQEKYKAPDMPVFAIKTNALYWATATLTSAWNSPCRKNGPWIFREITILGNGRGIRNLSIGWCSRNYVIGCAIGSAGISLVFMLFMPSLICAGLKRSGGNTSVIKVICSGVVSLTGITGYWVTVGVWKELLAWGMPISNMTSINVRSVVPSLKTGDGITWDPRN